MKKLIVLLAISVCGIFANAQTAFDNGMQKAFEYWGKGENDKAIASFARIAQVETTNWIPYYYEAQVGITSSFGEKDNTKRELLLRNASGVIDSLMKIKPDNSEIYTLKGLLLTAYVAFNPMVNGAKLSAETIMTFEKAIQLDSTNPRPYYLKAQFGMGAARFFKQDLKPYCNEVQNSIQRFDNFKPRGKYFPNWGKKQALAILDSNDCSKKEEEKENK